MGNCCIKSGDTVEVKPDPEDNRHSNTYQDVNNEKMDQVSELLPAKKELVVSDSSGPVGIRDKYEMGRKIGQGSFALVKIVIRREDRKKFAVKIMKKSLLRAKRGQSSSYHELSHAESMLNNTRDEVSIMKMINHKHCCRLIEVFETKSKIYMVVELLEGGDLFDYWHEKQFSEQHAANITKQVALGLDYLHENGIIHRDIKPENLIYTPRTEKQEGILKITDYGLSVYQDFSKEAQVAKLNTVCGTEIYMSPEMLSGGGYGKESDLWSLGVMLYELLGGHPPFYHNNESEVMNMIKEAKYDFPDNAWGGRSNEAKEVVRGLLTMDPKKRWTTKKILGTAWVNGAVQNKLFTADYQVRKKITRARRILRKKTKVIINIIRLVKTLTEVAKEVIKK